MTTYRNTGNAPQHVMGPREAVVGPGETIESEVALSGVFAAVESIEERIPAEPEEVTDNAS